MPSLVFTDVVDSTLLGERLGDARAASVWSAHDRRARDLVARHQGREIGRGDGFFLLFDGAVDAAQFALAYHAALTDLSLVARVGLHVGPVTLRDNPPADIARGARPIDVDGIAVALTSRLMGLARGGQTLLSDDARRALEGTVPAIARLERHGHYRMKGIGEPVEVYELGMRDASSFAPPPDADKAYRVVREDDHWRPVRDIRHNLPAERDSFIGRAGDLQRLAARLDADSRLVTVHGPGGMGKTRLVRRYARSWLGDWPGGAYFCDLSEARTLDGVLYAVASALEVPLGKDDPLSQLAHAIAGRGRCLVILDNVEQAVAPVATALGRWLDIADDAAFVATGREPLHLTGEEVFPLDALPPATEAIALFEARARARRPEFVLDASNRSAVAEVVAMLDGLPLAIELAAARVRILTPAQLVERMRDRFGLLAGARGHAARHATLRAAIDWSWDLLEPWERDAFAQCSTFEGGFTLAAAEAVLDLAARPAAPPVIDVVQALVDKSLLRSWMPTAAGRYDIAETYFGMYQSLHEYASERLAGQGPEAVSGVERRHGHYFASFGSEAAIDALEGTEGQARLGALAVELDNLVAACRRACVRGDGDRAGATYRAAAEVLLLRGPLALAVTLGEQVRNLAGMDVACRLAVDATLARALQLAGRTSDAMRRLDDTIASARAAGDRRAEGVAVLGRGTVLREQGNGAPAREEIERAIAVAREVRDRRLEGRARSQLGLWHHEHGELAAARDAFAAALAIARESGDAIRTGQVLGSLGMVESQWGEVDAARQHLEAARDAARATGDRQLEGAALANLATVESEQGGIDTALRLLESAVALHHDVGNRRLEAIALGNVAALCVSQGRFAEAEDANARALAIARDARNRRHEAFLTFSVGMLRHAQARLPEARASYEAALALAREVGGRREEGIALSRLALLLDEVGETEASWAHYDLALACAREGGYRRLEGVVLGGMGDLLANRGRTADALERVQAGEALLREVKDREQLVLLLCIRGRIEVAAGERTRAQAALDEAEAIVVSSGASPQGEVGQAVARLREALR